jgi:hypothetical protein
MRRALRDGSYLTFISSKKYRAGQGYGPRIEVRVVEAWITVTLADGTRRTELWRLLTNLLDAERYPAEELITLYHRRWQSETCYFSLKSTILDGRVLRSRSVPGLEQEIYALLTVYQALIRAAGDLTVARPDVTAERISFIVLLQAAADHTASTSSTAATIREPPSGTRSRPKSSRAALLTKPPTAKSNGVARRGTRPARMQAVMSGLRFVRQAPAPPNPSPSSNRDPIRGDQHALTRVTLPPGSRLDQCGRPAAPPRRRGAGRGSCRTGLSTRAPSFLRRRDHPPQDPLAAGTRQWCCPAESLK